MKKGFTLTEIVISIILVGILTAFSLPILTSQANPNQKLYNAAYSLVEIVANEMTQPFDSTFCTKFAACVNTIGPINCGSPDLTSSIPGVPNFITSNGMRWYGLDNTAADPIVISVDIDGSGRSSNTAGVDILRVNVARALGTVSRPLGALEQTYHP